MHLGTYAIPAQLGSCFEPLRGYISGTVSDVTERKRNEEKLRFAVSVFVHASERTMITTADVTIIDVNGALKHVAGR